MIFKNKLIPLTILFFCIAQTYGQWDLPTIRFKNGESITGVKFGFLKKEFQFQKDMKSKLVKYPYDSIQQIEINYRNGEKVLYEYWKIKDKKYGKPVEIVIDGYVSLYQYRMPKPGGTDFKYFLRKQMENEVTLYSKSEATRFISNQKNKVLDYFGDCDILKDGIKNKVLNARKIKDVVNFYNENCNN